MIKDEKRVKTDEFFYKDIVSVSTKSGNITHNNSFWQQIQQIIQNKNVTFEEFVLTTSGGTTIGATLHDYEEAEDSIKAFKNLLREKKQE
jgi:hypothetical protein